MRKIDKKLIGNLDAKIWAEEFVNLVKEKPSTATDEGTMIGWFANAIMAGYDAPQNISKQKVEEAIDKHFVCGYEQGLSGAVHSNKCRKCALLKELGLD